MAGNKEEGKGDEKKQKRNGLFFKELTGFSRNFAFSMVIMVKNFLFPNV